MNSWVIRNQFCDFLIEKEDTVPQNGQNQAQKLVSFDGGIYANAQKSILPIFSENV
jgi:hypothetical protein